MTNHVVSGLIAKRAELSGRIERLQNEIQQAIVEMDHIDATLRIFKPDIDFAEIAPRRVPHAHHAYRGEVSRVLIEALRKSDRPLSTRELTDVVMRERGFDASDISLHRVMQARVGASLAGWRKRHGVLRATHGPGGVLYWEIIPPERPLLAGR